MIRVLTGDCLDVLPTLGEASVDACVTDPPYGLSFMGKNWDHGVPGIPFWKAVFRVLKPGGHLLAFGGSRTYHRLACAIEDAGFEIRDQIMWLYGSGFPKSLDVSKAIDKAAGAEREVVGESRTRQQVQEHKEQSHGGWNGMETENGGVLVTAPATDAARKWQGWGTALKPAHEPIILARKPLIGTVAANVLAHGAGALNIGACRVKGAESTVRNNHGGTGNPEQWRTGNGNDFQSGSEIGRWPANLIHDGSEEVVGAFPESTSGLMKAGTRPIGQRAIYGQDAKAGYETTRDYGNDSGSAARFFYTAKADKGDRLSSKHPTVKPVDLMAYLCRLVCPPGGIVLDPFAGSGSTGMACMRDGFDAILIEREAEYVADIKRRIAHVSGEDAPLFAPQEAFI
jgi:site-specific DNA-methyltransferase (adenine-specific)